MVTTILALAVAAGCSLTNHPPSLIPIGDHSVRVGESLELMFSADDPDGDSLSFAMKFLDPIPPQGATLSRVSKDEARFHYSPLISDAAASGASYALRVLVEDGYGGSDQEDITITVFRQGGVPVFLNPHGYVLDLSDREYIAFDVIVKDDDSTEVEVRMAKSLDGALLDKRSSKLYEFYWRPSEALIDAQLFHTVIFEADDGEHPPTVHEVGIVLMNASADDGCPGTPPGVLHTPPGDQFGTASLVVEAVLQDDDSRIRLPTLYYQVDGDNSPEKALAMQDVGAGRYQAIVPTTSLPQAAGSLLRYHFTALDDDDPTSDRCDHSTRLPKEGSFVTAWYGPGAVDLCLDDNFEPDTATPSPLAFGEALERRLCPEDEDRFRLAIQPGARLLILAENLGFSGPLEMNLQDDQGQTIAVSTPQLGGARLQTDELLTAQSLTLTVWSSGTDNLSYSVKARDLGSDCQADAFEPNDVDASGFGQATTLTTGTYKGLVICPGDTDAFRVPLHDGENLSVIARFRHQQGDLDILVIDPSKPKDQQLIGVAESTTDDEQLFVNNPAGSGITELILVVLGFTDAANVYEIEIETGTVSDLCSEDLYSPNHSPIQARALIEGASPELVLCPGAEDWFSIGLNGGDVLELSFASYGPLEGLDLFAQSPDAVAVAVPCEQVDDNLRCTVQVTSAGTWRWGIASPLEHMRYAFSMWAREPAGACLDDRMEPNDQPEQAPELPPGITSHLKICGSGQDWFAIELEARQTLTLHMLHLAEQGNLDVRLYDPAGFEILAAAETSEEQERINYTPDDAGRYRLMVWGFGVENAFYDLVYFLE